MILTMSQQMECSISLLCGNALTCFSEELADKIPDATRERSRISLGSRTHMRLSQNLYPPTPAPGSHTQPCPLKNGKESVNLVGGTFTRYTGS